MADQVDPALSSSLSAPASDAPARQRSTDSQTAQHKEQQQSPQPASETPQATKDANGSSKASTKPTKGKEPAPASTDGAADTPEKLSGAELKKRAKAEKAARRAREKQEREQSGAGAPTQGGGATPKKGQPGKDQQRPLPRRGSAQPATAGAQGGGALEQKKKKEEKNVAVFGHLYGQQRRTTVAGAGKEVHPAVLALGLQMRDYVVCGSSARCVATLLAFKRVCVFMSCYI